jgi:hypothetical protein
MCIVWLMNKPFVILYGGIPGTSKSIISHHLSCVFNLPIYANDTLRFEIREDLMIDDNSAPEVIAEFEKRNYERRQRILSGEKSVIFDNSVDRCWAEQKKDLIDAGYTWYMINMELSQAYLIELFSSTGRIKFVDRINHYLKEHKEFTSQYGDDIDLNITDSTFRDRLLLSEAGLREFIGSLQTQKRSLISSVEQTIIGQTNYGVV